MKGKGILVVAVAVLVLGAGTASAAKSYPTTVNFRDSDGTASDVLITGDLRTNVRCRGGRTVKMFKRTGSSFKLLDVDRTSRNGAWAVRGDLTGLPDVKIKATKSTRKKGAIVCRADSLLLFPSKL
jgi:hypothetical protein